MTKQIYLIGHGNMQLNEFLELLNQEKIDTVIDVRSVPFSKYVPDFNKENFEKFLSENEIDYVYMGGILGGRQPEGFDKYMNSNQFEKGIDILEEGVSGSVAAIMCSELDHTKCHRRFIAAKLVDRGFIVKNLTKCKVETVNQRTLGNF
ncbi:MAG: DUF488 domain-containing protein [Nanoarchaeota archaeon]|nr:DUF488 domain-containing protein [Nanoarchaeota archaeon]MBU1005092.1 DUF488 domain-containing protein [Nanoarchaeota archaeon]MBU1946434.1 DUF488 domain-containing protein [Nanoarchaeota archaeon]